MMWKQTCPSQLAIMILHLAKLDSYTAERVDTGLEEIAGCGYRHGTQSAGQHEISAPQRPPQPGTRLGKPK
jgi:hypothetical protein